MIIFIVASVLFFGIIAYLAEKKAPEEYSSSENTISELACQTYENSYIMQWGFKGLGIILFMGIMFNYSFLVNEPYYYIPLALYAVFMFLSGTFATKPFEHLVFYSIKEFKLNAIFKQLAGFSLYLLIVMKFIVELGIFNRVVNIVVLITVLIFSAQVGRKSTNRGIYNRLQYFISFIWLIYSNSVMMN